MYSITWDRETGGVALHSRRVDGTLGISPRPVFWEELDLLKLNELGWSYPHSDEPLLWAVNKQYWYRGELVFEAKGANIYDEATVVFQPGQEKLVLKPVDVKRMLARNADLMFLLESEAIEFIHETYEQYAGARKTMKAAEANTLDFEALAAKAEKKTKQKMAIVKQDCDSFDIMPLVAAESEGKRVYQTTKIDKFLASFSGGKDSQVVLDLCTRAIPSTDFEVIYSDTGYELPPSLQLYERIQKQYHENFPDLKFSVARNHESVLNYWDKIGTPSDTHRWCCSVMKTAPLYRMMKTEKDGISKQARVLTFDGLRAEESIRRANNARIGKGVKHNTVINASPILRWSSVEIFLYLFKYNILINPAYRQGMTRVGCLICPFSSEWNDMVSNQCYKDNLNPFLQRIENIAEKSGIKDIHDYVREGKWKLRAGGRGIDFPSRMEVVSSKTDLILEISNPQKPLFTWLRAVGKFQLNKENEEIQKGELSYSCKIYSFSVKRLSKNTYKIVFVNAKNDPTLTGLIKRAFSKSTYCVDCEACEVECPTGALTILPNAQIKQDKCVSCHKCLTFHDHGCIAAASLFITGNRNNQSKMKLISYNNFGLNGDWFEYFVYNHEDYFKDNSHGLHIKEQLPSFVKWLVQSQVLVDAKSKQLTEFGQMLCNIYTDMPDLVWQLIWINLSYNSPIAQWFKENVNWSETITQKDIEERVYTEYPENSKTTVHNVVYALFRTFKESPIGEAGQLIEVSKNIYTKRPYDELEKEAVIYSLYKYAEEKGVSSFRVSDLYADDNVVGIYKEFGIQKPSLTEILRALNSENNRLIIAELNMGLDNITLRDGLSAIEALKLIVQ